MLASTRSKVSMDVITADDAKFQLSYALVRTEDGWRVRNIVINGINVGLTYRSQFDALMREYDGDISAAIAHWRPTIEEATLKASG
jgi:phospholipid transport system substrate-binding protein